MMLYMSDGSHNPPLVTNQISVQTERILEVYCAVNSVYTNSVISNGHINALQDRYPHCIHFFDGDRITPIASEAGRCTLDEMGFRVTTNLHEIAQPFVTVFSCTSMKRMFDCS